METINIPAKIREMVEILIRNDAIIYGKPILDDYKESPKETVLLISHELSLSGAPILLFRFSLVLQKKGYQTVIMAPNDGRLGEYAAEHGIPVVVLPNLFQSEFVPGVRRLFAMVVANTAAAAPAVRALCDTDTPVMWWIHEAEKYYSPEAIKNMPRSVTDNIHIYCGGDYAKRVLLNRFPQYRSGILMYYCPDLAEGNGGYKNDFDNERVTTYALVGAIEDRKGQDVLAKAITHLRKDVRENCRFVFIGTVIQKKIEKRILRLIKKYPARIKYYGELGPEELYRFYQEIDFLICASRDDPAPVVVAEAMSLSKPCICSAGSGLFESIERYGAGLTYTNNDPRKLRDLISRTSRMNEAEYTRMSEQARKAYEEIFSAEAFEKNVTEVLDEILG